MAITTYLIRMIPLVFFKKEIKNEFFNAFLYYVPYACLASMTFPAILYGGEYIISGVVALIVSIFFSYKGKSMVVVAIYACISVYIIEFIMRLL